MGRRGPSHFRFPHQAPPPAACSAHQRFHLQPVLLLTSADQATLGRARAGVGGTTPTDTFQSTTPTDPPFSSEIPFNLPHPQMHCFRQRYLSIHHTHRCSTFVKDTFSFSLPFNPGQSISSQHLVYNNAPTLTIVLPSREMAQGCFSQDARNGAGHCVDER